MLARALESSYQPLEAALNDRVKLPPMGFQNARREQNSVSAGLERRLLTWLAERAPAAINSDHLTLLGFVSMFMVGLSYAWAHWNRLGLAAATLGLALNWLGDSLDGTLARVRNRQRPRYGFYVDHILDTFGALFLTAGVAASGYLDWRVADGMLIAFLMLSIETYLATYTLGTFKLSFWRFGPTELRILLAAANVALWFKPAARLAAYRLFDLGGSIGTAGMAAMLVVTSVQHIVRLYREEKLA
jgi:archaetidylinositol phosphate synthase